ncbi:hypothetical protein, partial [Yersinia enterocolitica]|uniref:hypothetical protein n=1 Tax=Yersinia enterocolitica TaxID=630 RepID=UPI001C609A09
VCRKISKSEWAVLRGYLQKGGAQISTTCGVSTVWLNLFTREKWNLGYVSSALTIGYKTPQKNLNKIKWGYLWGYIKIIIYFLFYKTNDYMVLWTPVIAKAYLPLSLY